jgi:glutamyl endopeptidase
MAFYAMDTFGGQSGSPVWRDKAGCGPCGMAIHAYGYPHTTGLHRTANHGPRITPTRYDMITDLADDNNTP